MQHCGYFLDRHIRLLCASDAELVPFFNDFNTSCFQNLQFDAKNSLASASLNRKSCKLILIFLLISVSPLRKRPKKTP